MFKKTESIMEVSAITFRVIICIVVMCLLVESIIVIILWYRSSL